MSTLKSPPNHFTLLYFASASSHTGRQHDFFQAPLPVTRLPEVLEEKYPGMKEKVLVSCAWTVNLDYVDLEEESEKKAKGEEGMVVREGDEVAVVPPVSSG